VSPNNSVTVSPPVTTVDNGSLVNFTCSAGGGPDNMFIWVRSTSLSQVAATVMPLLAKLPLMTDYIINGISSSIIRNGSILTIPSVNATQDGGGYSCLVINEAGIGFDSTVLFVRPTITQHPDDVNTIVNATVTLSCLADAFPAPSYIWEFFNTATNTFEIVPNSNDSVLTFSSINYEDNGEYRCVATSFGEVIENATSTTAVITVSPLGSVFITPQTNNSFNGSLVTLTCNARGGPSNTFTWTYLRTEEVVSNQSVYEFVSDVSTGGIYQCSVQNEAGSDNNTATVNVGPIITINPVSTNVTIDIANITLTCEAIGVPVPVIIWTHNETIILNANGETGTFDNNALIVEVDNTTLGTIRSTLTIFIALANNTGDYTCNATSPVDFYESVISDVALVLVQAVPDEPINLTATNVTSRNLTLSWVEPHDNNAPISGYYVFYNLPDFFGSNEVTLITGTSEMLFIDDLHPGETYNFTVIAFNEEGNSSRSLPLSVLMLEEVPSGFPQDLNSTTINDTAILVSWASVLPSEANGIITGYTISITTDVSFVEEFENAIEDADTFDFLFTGLEEYVNYTFSISASTSIGPGPLSPSVISLTNEAIPAAPPQNFTVSDTTPNDISLSWDTPPIQDINGVIDNYIIRYKIIEQLGISINPDTSNVENVSVNGTDTMGTLSQLGNYTVYEISISAVTIGEGPDTTIIQRTDQNVPGAPPTSLEVVTNSTTSINITWTAPPLNMTYGIIILYEIQYGEYDDITGTLKDGTTKDGTTLIAQVNTTDNATFSMEFGDLQEARTYGFQVRAYTVGPGPYTDIIINTTFPAPPDVAPANVTAPPPDEIEPTSVTLSWDPIPIDQQNGNLTYDVSINALELLNETPTRLKRQTGPPLSGNSLEQCLMAANISDSFNVLVPGSMTSVTLNDIAPNVNYRFTVTGVTSAGSGPTSNPANFPTSQGIAEAPQTLTVTNTSSTILNVMWDVPICDNGVRTGYVITYEAFPHPLDTHQTNQTNIQLNDPDISQRNIEGLTPNTVYQVSICAVNGAQPRRCGLNITMNRSTSEDAPEQVTEFALSNPTSPQVIANWTLPSARFGTFQLRFTYIGRQDFFYPSRPDRTQSVSASESILSGDVTSFNITDALPFANYTVMIQAFNDKVPIGAIQSRGVVVIDTILTLPTESSAVVDFTATTQSYTSIFLSWVVPLSPNGIITHYTVRYTNIMTGAQEHANTTDVHHILHNLESGADYDLTVQPVTIFNDITYIGEISNTVRVSLNTSDHDVFPFPSPSMLGTFDFTVRLQRPELFGDRPLLFYGVIIAKNFPPNSSVDLQQQYPNPGPYRESASYYITAAWNRDVPQRLKIGDDRITTARTVDGVDTPYRNKGLDRRTEYSVLAIVYLDSGVPGVEIVRYARIIQVVTTELGYNEGALGFFMSAIILGIIIGIIVIIVLILLILKKKNKGFYSFMKREYEENEMSTIARGKPEAGIVIVNPPFAGTEPVNGTYVDISSKEAISVEEFPAHVAKMHSNDDYLFSVEYPSIEPQHHPTTEATSHPDNAIKNRYANITAYDHSRVKLREIPNIPGSDYINANFIDGFQEKNAYIASQGPVPHSIADFWRMIWEQNTAIIVMLTNLEEKGRIKCHLYWPPPDKKVSVQGQIRIELQEELSLTDYTIRTFTLQHKNSPDERTIKQFHFTSWPDFGVPEHPTSLLRFIHKVASTNPDDAGPIVVHCSAGVGRTGTFVTISTQIQRINTNKNLDIYNFVQAMRFRRCFMVQTEPQYIFIHDALLEYLECGETEVAAREFKDQYHRLLNSMSQEEGKSCLEFEFDNIQETIHKEPIVFAGTQTFNRPKNRYANVMPFDKTRCKLSTVPGIDGSDYINANFIEGYHKGKAFIATQGPLPDTIDDFWRMIWEHKCTSIVMLANEREGAKVMCHKYWPDNGSQMYGSYEVTLYSHKEYPDYVLREFKIVDSRDPEGSSQHIKQFQYVSWPSKGVPLSAIGLLDLREQVEKWQRTSGDKPIVVHCSGGCGRTGTYISICLLVDRLKSEGLVDVFQTVRALRLQRPGMVRSVEQYDFCYKSVLEYLGSFDTYANFSL
jgi:protein tyrosine phosphatase